MKLTRQNKQWIFILLTFAYSIVQADTAKQAYFEVKKDFLCTIERTSFTQPEWDSNKIYKDLMGKKFSVERKTGTMRGVFQTPDEIDAKVVFNRQIEVIDEKWAYKLIETTKVLKSKSVRVLMIITEKESNKNPFLYLDDYQAVLYGNCEYY